MTSFIRNLVLFSLLSLILAQSPDIEVRSELLEERAVALKKAYRLPWVSAKALIVFGDSYTRVQGPLGKSHFTFIGDRQHIAFTPQQLLTNPINMNLSDFPTSARGPNWVEYLTQCGTRTGLTLPRSCHTQLWSFAFGGAEISDSLIPAPHPYTMSLELQIQQFLNYGAPALSYLPKSQVQIASWIGINDMKDSSRISLANRSPAFYKRLQNKHMAIFDRVYDLGYRQFLFMNLPPIDQIPAYQGSTNGRVNTTMIKWFNAELTAAVARFSANHTDAVARVFDAETLLRGVMANPSKYGIKNTTSFCASWDQPEILTKPWKYGCQPLKEFFWLDGLHITFRVHEIIAQALRTFLG